MTNTIHTYLTSVITAVAVRVWDEYETSVEHPLYLSVSTVGLHIMLPPPVSLMMS